MTHPGGYSDRQETFLEGAHKIFWHSLVMFFFVVCVCVCVCVLCVLCA